MSLTRKTLVLRHAKADPYVLGIPCPIRDRNRALIQRGFLRLAGAEHQIANVFVVRTAIDNPAVRGKKVTARLGQAFLNVIPEATETGLYRYNCHRS